MKFILTLKIVLDRGRDREVRGLCNPVPIPWPSGEQTESMSDLSQGPGDTNSWEEQMWNVTPDFLTPTSFYPRLSHYAWAHLSWIVSKCEGGWFGIQAGSSLSTKSLHRRNCVLVSCFFPPTSLFLAQNSHKYCPLLCQSFLIALMRFIT